MPRLLVGTVFAALSLSSRRALACCLLPAALDHGQAFFSKICLDPAGGASSRRMDASRRVAPVGDDSYAKMARRVVKLP